MIRIIESAGVLSGRVEKILDADEGKSYKVRIRVSDGGKKLEVRGYIGMPLLGRTQTWLRTE